MAPTRLLLRLLLLVLAAAATATTAAAVSTTALDAGHEATETKDTLVASYSSTGGDAVANAARRRALAEHGVDADEHEVARLLTAFEVHDFAELIAPETRRALALAGAEQAPRELEVRMRVLGTTADLVLVRDDALFAPGFEHVVVDEKGNAIRSEKKPDCVYRVAWKGDADAKTIGAASVCDGIVHATIDGSSAAASGLPSFSIAPVQLEPGETKHIVYRHSDAKPQQAECGVGKFVEASRVAGDHLQHEHAHTHHHHHDNNNNMRREHAHAPDSHADSSHALHDQHGGRSLLTSTKYIDILIVNDNLRYQQYKQYTGVHAAKLFGIANTLYAKFGNDPDTPSSSLQIQLRIIGMYTFGVADPWGQATQYQVCLLYTSDAADD